MRNDFAIFILTHGRADNIKTLKTLKKGNYTGKYYILIDNEDEQEEEYRKLYGDKVIQFDKIEESKVTDEMDTQKGEKARRAIVYARNAVFDEAKKLGLKYFLQLDDDYTTLDFRYERDGQLKATTCRQLDRLFSDMVDFLEESGAYTIAFAQAGDFIGGLEGGRYRQKIIRKAMNTFFCKVDERITFFGRMNEDVNMYTVMGNRGKLIMSITDAAIVQEQTQKGKGGMSEEYLKSGTYVKAFYSVMCSPQCVKVGMLNSSHKRIHHSVDWEHCAPKILNERWRKPREDSEENER